MRDAINDAEREEKDVCSFFITSCAFKSIFMIFREEKGERRAEGTRASSMK
jgi:hypothetical protein